MQHELEEIAKACQGLVFVSESEYPFTIIILPSNNIEKELRQWARQPEDAPIEIQPVDYFFRNMIKTYPGDSQESQATAKRFEKLLELLKRNLKQVQVYRIGTIQVEAFIIGALDDGRFAGLMTKLIET